MPIRGSISLSPVLEIENNCLDRIILHHVFDSTPVGSRIRSVDRV